MPFSPLSPPADGSPSPRRTARRLPLVAGLSAGGVLLLATPAFAHVTVQSDQAPKGGYATVDFKVPNERDNADTTKVEVDLPTDHPLASVMAQPVPGWKVHLTRTKLAKPVTLEGEKIDSAVTKVTWTGGSIRPGYFEQFPLSIGALPKDADQLTFKALQTYSGGEVVRWIEPTREGQPEPQNPAPVLRLTAAQDETAGTDAKPGAPAGRTTAAVSSGSAGTSDTTARVLGVVGIVVGVAGVAFGVLAGRRRRA